MSKPGKLIVIEGADGAGKGTQFELLKEYLQSGGELTTFDFPRYETSFFGKLVGRALNGEFGDFSTFSPEMASLPYMLDRLGARDEIKAALLEGNVLCNRYTTANIIYNGARVTKKERKAAIDFTIQAEYEELGLPRPDVVIFLHVPEEISHKLIEKKSKRSYTNQKKDSTESNRDLQKNVVEVASDLVLTFDNWFMVSCVKNGKLLSIPEVHEKVRSIVTSALKQ